MKVFRFPFFILAVLLLLFPLPESLNAQDISAEDESFGDFGFGEPEDGFGFQDGGSSNPSVNISGEARAELKLFYNDFNSAETMKEIRLGDIFSGDLNFEAGASFAQAVINLTLTPVFDGTSSPVEIDEAYGRFFFGPITVTGGIRKLTWGKADSFGPLDVINPLDYTDLTKLSRPQSVKIARPMLHASWSMGAFSKLEAVFVPWFQGHKFVTSGRWAPGQIDDLRALVKQTLAKAISIADESEKELLNAINETGASLKQSIADGSLYPETNILKYAQAGLRFTTTIGSSDFGLQYFFGRLPRPSISGLNPQDFFIFSNLSPVLTGINPKAITPDIDYNYYHQIAADFARVIAGVNLRAEAGVNITNDLDGTDGAVYNPSLIWSLGFDRDVFFGINLNLQGTGQIRLFHDRIGENFFDCETGTDVTSTRITGIVSRKFLRDELELKGSVLWGIEDKDFLILPAVVWSRNDVSAELSVGFFGGDKTGELGQYRENSFARVILSYSF